MSVAGSASYLSPSGCDLCPVTLLGPVFVPGPAADLRPFSADHGRSLLQLLQIRLLPPLSLPLWDHSEAGANEPHKMKGQRTRLHVTEPDQTGEVEIPPEEGLEGV